MKTHFPEENSKRCPACNRYFESEEAKLNHISLKHPLLVCEVCGVSFKRQEDLIFHKRSMHSNDDNNNKANSMICPFEKCGRRFIKLKFSVFEGIFLMGINTVINNVHQTVVDKATKVASIFFIVIHTNCKIKTDRYNSYIST